MSDLLEKLRKGSKLSYTSILEESEFFNAKEQTPTAIPALNIALSGELDGGLTSGILQIAGESKHFKTSFALHMASAYLKKYPDAILIFYDSEFGSPKEYFHNFEVDTNRVLHCPISNVEELKFDIMSQMDNINRDDRVMILIDSIGNLASKKEVDDAKNEKAVADMSRAKQLKSLFRMVTPACQTKNIPLVAINHVYRDISNPMFQKLITGGGTGLTYSSNDIWIVGRSQEKANDGSIAGYNFTINVEKSRTVKEKSKIAINVTYEKGISKFSNMLDLAIEYEAVQKAPGGWYIKRGSETKCRERDLYTDEWLESLLGDNNFKEFVKKKYKL